MNRTQHTHVDYDNNKSALQTGFVHRNYSNHLTTNETKSSDGENTNRSFSKHNDNNNINNIAKSGKKLSNINMEYAMKIVVQICLNVIEWRTLT